MFQVDRSVERLTKRNLSTIGFHWKNTAEISHGSWHMSGMHKVFQPLNWVVFRVLRYYGAKKSLWFKIKVGKNLIFFFNKINKQPITNQTQFTEIFKVCMLLHFWFSLWIILVASDSHHWKDLFSLFSLSFFTINYYVVTQVSLVPLIQYHHDPDSPWLSILTLLSSQLCVSYHLSLLCSVSVLNWPDGNPCSPIFYISRSL